MIESRSSSRPANPACGHRRLALLLAAILAAACASAPPQPAPPPPESVPPPEPAAAQEEPSPETPAEPQDGGAAATAGEVAEATSESMETPPAPEPTVDDEILETRILLKFTADPTLALFDIQVGSTRGNVVLTGTVRPAEARQRAEMLARQTEGVRSVTNRLSEN